MSDLLKQVIQDLINDRTEQAQVSIHDYIVAKTQEVAGLTEAKSSNLFVIVDENQWDEDYENGGGESMLDIYEVTSEELKALKWREGRDGKLCAALESGKVGKKTGDQAKVFNNDPDLGAEGNMVEPSTVTMLFP